MSPTVIEGTWEEIKLHEAELTGRKLRVTIEPESAIARKHRATTTNATSTSQRSSRVSAMGKYAGLLSTEEFIGRKQEDIDLEDRVRE